MVNFITEEQLDRLSIFQLRNLCRELGHNCPTDKKKAELVDSVLSLKELPDPVNDAPVKRRGRPPKDQGGSDLIKLVQEYLLKQGVDYRTLSNADGAEAEDYAARVASKYQEPEKKERKDYDRREAQGRDYDRRDRDYTTRDYEREKMQKRMNGNRFRTVKDGYEPESPARRIAEYRELGGTRPDDDDRMNKNRYTDRTKYDPQDSVAYTEVREREGILEICPDGYGFLRAKNYEQGPQDAYISAQLIKRFKLRKGDYVKANAKKNAENRPPNVVEVLSVNDKDPQEMFQRPWFESLVPVYPDERYKLELAGAQADLAAPAVRFSLDVRLQLYGTRDASAPDAIAKSILSPAQRARAEALLRSYLAGLWEQTAAAGCDVLQLRTHIYRTSPADFPAWKDALFSLPLLSEVDVKSVS